VNSPGSSQSGARRDGAFTQCRNTTGDPWQEISNHILSRVGARSLKKLTTTRSAHPATQLSHAPTSPLVRLRKSEDTFCNSASISAGQAHDPES
jgi:hypothetical protein